MNLFDRKLQPSRISALSTTARIRFLLSFTCDPRSGYGVGALAAPGVTAHDPLESEPSAAGSAIALKCGDRIGRTARLITAAWRKHPGGALLPPASNQNEQLGDHGRTFSSALARSVRRASNPRSIPPERPIMTWSDPQW